MPRDDEGDGSKNPIVQQSSCVASAVLAQMCSIRVDVGGRGAQQQMRLRLLFSSGRMSGNFPIDHSARHEHSNRGNLKFTQSQLILREQLGLMPTLRRHGMQQCNNDPKRSTGADADAAECRCPVKARQAAAVFGV
jgi:hypothetical protein